MHMRMDLLIRLTQIFQLFMCLVQEKGIFEVNMIFIYWRNICRAFEEAREDEFWAFDGYPIGRNLLSLIMHSLAHELVHAMLNGLGSRYCKHAGLVQHGRVFQNMSGFIFGHPHVMHNCIYGGWSDVPPSFSLQDAWACTHKAVKSILTFC